MIVGWKTRSSWARQGGGTWAGGVGKGRTAQRIRKHWTLPNGTGFLQGCGLVGKSSVSSNIYIYLDSTDCSWLLEGTLSGFLSSSGGPMPHVILFPNQLPAIFTDNFNNQNTKTNSQTFTQFYYFRFRCLFFTSGSCDLTTS